jgi:hypothetical protein
LRKYSFPVIVIIHHSCQPKQTRDQPDIPYQYFIDRVFVLPWLAVTGNVPVSQTIFHGSQFNDIHRYRPPAQDGVGYIITPAFTTSHYQAKPHFYIWVTGADLLGVPAVFMECICYRV